MSRFSTRRNCFFFARLSFSGFRIWKGGKGAFRHRDLTAGSQVSWAWQDSQPPTPAAWPAQPPPESGPSARSCEMRSSSSCCQTGRHSNEQRLAPDQIYPKTPSWEHLQVAAALLLEGTGNNPILATTVWLCRSSPQPPRVPRSFPDGKAMPSPYESTACWDPYQCCVSLALSPRVPAIPGAASVLVFSSLKEKLSLTPPCRTSAASSAEESPSCCSWVWLDFPSPPSAAHSILQRRSQGKELEQTGAQYPGRGGPWVCQATAVPPNQEQGCNSPLAQSLPSAHSPGAASGSPPAAASSPAEAAPKCSLCVPPYLPLGLNLN